MCKETAIFPHPEGSKYSKALPSSANATKRRDIPPFHAFLLKNKLFFIFFAICMAYVKNYS